jgi:hypothetical protein
VTIEIATPDGSSFQFPDGTPQDAITRALDTHFGKAPAAPQAAGVTMTDAERRAAPAGKFLEGIPVLGAYVPQAGAAIQAAAHGVTGVGAEGETFSERYAKNLAREKELSEAVEKGSPGLSAALKVGGGVASLLPIGATAIGARALGLAGGSVPAMMARGAASGAALTAADAAARGDDVKTAGEIGAVTGAAGPVIGRAVGAGVQSARNLIRGGAPAVPANVVPIAGVDVPISGGQATGDVATQMMEQTALRGGEGQGPQRVAEQFFRETQAPAVETARANIGQNLDRFGQNIVSNPQDAAELVSESVRNAERASRQNYGNLYETARTLPGEIHAAAFEGIGQKIKGRLSLGQDPVIIDDVTTPVASRAIQDIDNQISQLKIQNRADPFGQPDPQNITGVNLAGVDQVRKRLVSMASAAERGSADRRAVGRVIGEFDNHVEDSIANGLFTGDDRALTALRNARDAYSQHRQLFRAQGPGDDVGRAMERIVGRNGQEGATPTEVANYLYGSARVGGTGLSVRLAQRMQNVLGPDSPEWSAIRQGLWSRLTQATEGTTEMGAQKLTNRLSEFLNGSGQPLAHVMFTPQERALMERFANLQRQLTPRPGTVNTSNTAPVLRMLASNALKGITVLLGDVAAGPVGAVAGLGANAATRAIGERSAAGRVARSLYRSPAQNAADRIFLQQMARYGSFGARAIAPATEQPQAVQ